MPVEVLAKATLDKWTISIVAQVFRKIETWLPPKKNRPTRVFIISIFLKESLPLDYQLPLGAETMVGALVGASQPLVTRCDPHVTVRVSGKVCFAVNGSRSASPRGISPRVH